MRQDLEPNHQLRRAPKYCVLACAAIAQAETPVEGQSELREVSRWFGTGRSRGSAARQVEWLPRVEGEEVGFASDSPLEGTGFEPSVPRKAPDVVMVSVLGRADFSVRG
jgi:hypothetical protein